jgi:hypothetical protein
MASPAPVPYSQLQPYKYYIVPPPSDEARFLTATFARNADDYLNEQRSSLLGHIGRRMQLSDKWRGAWSTLLERDKGKAQSIYFDETSFPPGQLFQEVSWDWKPSGLAPMADPWDEFDPREMGFASDAEEEAYYKKNPPVKLTDVLTQADIAAQNQFASTLNPAEWRALNAYKGEGHKFMGPLMAGVPEYSLGVVRYAREETRADREDRLPKERPGPGFIREFMSGFLSALSRAPKLTQEINVFRGISGKQGLNIDGTLAMSTSYNKHVAFTFSNGRGGCCMLKINVKPGVRIFVWGPPDPECEIMVLPPYNAKIEDVEHSHGNMKQVTITPAKYRGGTRRRRRLRQTKKRTSKL